MVTIYDKTAEPEGAQPNGPDLSVPPKARPVLDRISVNGIPIAEADVLAEAQNHPAETPGEALLQAARALVVRSLLLQEAQRLGLEQMPSEDDDGRYLTQEDTAVQALIEREVDVPTATEDECRRYFNLHPDRFRSDTIHEARHILLTAPASDTDARKKAKLQAEELIARLTEQPADFEALARKYSDCPSWEVGGSLGQLTHGSTVPEFERALDRLEEGALSPNPVESRFGFHVVRLDRSVAGTPLPFDLVQDRIAAWLDASAWSKAVSQYVAVLAGRARIEGIDLQAADGPLLQ